MHWNRSQFWGDFRIAFSQYYRSNAVLWFHLHHKPCTWSSIGTEVHVLAHRIGTRLRAFSDQWTSRPECTLYLCFCRSILFGWSYLSISGWSERRMLHRHDNKDMYRFVISNCQCKGCKRVDFGTCCTPPASYPQWLLGNKCHREWDLWCHRSPLHSKSEYHL